MTDEIDYESFINQSSKLNTDRTKITGRIYSARVKEMKISVMEELRYLDKIIDELTKGKSLNKIFRKDSQYTNMENSLYIITIGKEQHMLIDLKNIARRKQGKEIIKNISWRINEGEKWMLYGLNGAGKTTLLNILNAYEPNTSGELTLFGMQPGKIGYSADKVRNQIGFVSNSLMERFQDGEIVRDVVISGIFKSIGIFKEVEDRYVEMARHYLTQMGMSEFESQYYGYLSTGERQKVLIARALMGNPKLLILDEPASGLDFIAREDLLDALEQLYQRQPELSVIYVTHFVEEITKDIQRGFLLKDGTCYKQGQIQNVLNSDTLSDFFNRRVSVLYQNERYSLFLKR
nr:DUF2200 family protein [Staphylococcus shinii]